MRKPVESGGLLYDDGLGVSLIGDARPVLGQAVTAVRLQRATSTAGVVRMWAPVQNGIPKAISRS
jgi:hypothetical protein